MTKRNTEPPADLVKAMAVAIENCDYGLGETIYTDCAQAAISAINLPALLAAEQWRDFHKDPPPTGSKVAIVCDDGCSTGLAYITDEGALDGEDGMPLGVMFLQGAIWMALPDDYPIAFMEAHDDY